MLPIDCAARAHTPQHPRQDCGSKEPPPFGNANQPNEQDSRNNQQFNGMAGPHACAEPSKGDNFERMTVFLGRSNHLSKSMASKRGIRFHGNILLSTAEKLLETPHFLLESTLLDEPFLASSHAPGRNLSRLFRGGRGGLQLGQEAVHFCVAVEAREAFAHVVGEQLYFGGGHGFAVMHAVLEPFERRAFRMVTEGSLRVRHFAQRQAAAVPRQQQIALGLRFVEFLFESHERSFQRLDLRSLVFHLFAVALREPLRRLEAFERGACKMSCNLSTASSALRIQSRAVSSFSRSFFSSMCWSAQGMGSRLVL